MAWATESWGPWDIGLFHTRLWLSEGDKGQWDKVPLRVMLKSGLKNKGCTKEWCPQKAGYQSQGSDLEGWGCLGGRVRGIEILTGTEPHGRGSRPGLPRLWELLWGAQVLLIGGDRAAERGCGPAWRRDRGHQGKEMKRGKAVPAGPALISLPVKLTGCMTEPANSDPDDILQEKSLE